MGATGLVRFESGRQSGETSRLAPPFSLTSLHARISNTD
jgi:hypothetical protein